MKKNQLRVEIICNQCSHTWIESDGITQAVQCPRCKQWDVTIDVLYKLHASS